MSEHPIISIIINTLNSEKTLGLTLSSLARQQFKDFELILVDNFSRDGTADLAKNYNAKVFLKGPERSAQRNFGAKNSTGEFIFFLDSDMVLPSDDYLDKLLLLLAEKKPDLVIVPFINKGDGYLAKCRELESELYLKSLSHLAFVPRVFKRDRFEALEGYDEMLDAGEDIDILLRAMNRQYTVTSFCHPVFHLVGNIHLRTILKKSIWSMRFVAKYIEKRNKMERKLSGTRFISIYLEGIKDANLVQRWWKHIPGLLFIKIFIDILPVALAYIKFRLSH